MKVIKFVSKCILEGLKFVIPAIFILVMSYLILNYLTLVIGEKVLTITLIIAIILFLSFVFGAIKFENDRLKYK